MAFSGQRQNTGFGRHSGFVNALVAAGQGALDELTFGLDDQAYAGARALIDAAHGKSLKDAYRQRISYEHARDQYYAQHYGTARAAGQVGGALVQMAATGPVSAAAKAAVTGTRLAKAAKVAMTSSELAKGARALAAESKLAKAGERAVAAVRKADPLAGKVAKRIKQATPITRREHTAIAGAGAIGGGVSQGASDLANGHLSSFGDYAGAMMGGAADGWMAIHGRPMRAGAVDGAITSLSQDLFNGRAPSLEHAGESAFLGGAGGAVAGSLGRVKARSMTTKQKEQMGELGSRIRTKLSGDTTISTDKIAYPLSSGYTIPDQRTALDKLIESKFGTYARLTKRQLQAFAELGSKYRIDHFVPQDIGSVYGFMGAHARDYLPDYVTNNMGLAR
jgi:hypothetical protein